MVDVSTSKEIQPYPFLFIEMQRESLEKKKTIGQLSTLSHHPNGR